MGKQLKIIAFTACIVIAADKHDTSATVGLGHSNDARNNIHVQPVDVYGRRFKECWLSVDEIAVCVAAVIVDQHFGCCDCSTHGVKRAVSQPM